VKLRLTRPVLAAVTGLLLLTACANPDANDPDAADDPGSVPTLGQQPDTGAALGGSSAPGGGSEAPSTPPSTAPGGSDASSSQPPAPPDAGTDTGKPATFTRALSLRRTAIGNVVVDDKGWVLYLYTKDTSKPSKSNCYGQCIAAWPASTGDASNIAARGISPKLIGTVDRADGTSQLTLGGWPLYRYAGDKKAGDISGQGVNNVWFVVGADGKAIKTRPVGAGGY
jgi:predicted lipoprotein with Yx(FWY)xxD motif